MSSVGRRLRRIARDLRRRTIGRIGRRTGGRLGNFLSGADSSVARDSAQFTPPAAPLTFSPIQGFGVTLISEGEMRFASQREPVIKWLTYWVAVDMFDNWIKIIDPKHPENNALDEAAQPVLKELDAKRQLTRLLQFERRYGTSIMLCGYTIDDGETWESPIYDEHGNLNEGRQLLQITPYPWSKVNVTVHDENQTSLRYGWPQFYDIRRGGNVIGSTETTAHWSRVIHAATRIDEEVYEGTSVIYAIYDDAAGFRNARWAQYETMFRYGSGFPHFHFPNATPKQVADWIAAGRFANVNARGFFVSTGVGDEAESVEFIGVKGVTLNPEPYNEMAAWNLSMASRIPQDVLKGVSAGRITGSEVNERAYFKFINAEQSNVEHIVRELIDRLIDTGQIRYKDKRRGRRGRPNKDYIIEWNYPQLTPERDQATINYLNERAQTERLEYLTIDEVRAKADPPLPPLPNGEGKICLGPLMHTRGEFSEFASNPEKRTEEQTTEEDSFTETVLEDALKKK